MVDKCDRRRHGLIQLVHFAELKGTSRLQPERNNFMEPLIYRDQEQSCTLALGLDCFVNFQGVTSTGIE